MVRQVNFAVDDDLLDEFDIWCIKNKTKRKEVLINHMKKCVGK